MREGFKIEQLKNGRPIAEFKNVNEATKTTGLHNALIHACIRGRRRTTGGFGFRQKEDVILGEVWGMHPLGIECSDHGRVKTSQGRITTGFHSKRYLSMKWCQKNYYVHRIVLETFVGVAPEGFECDHIDRNPENNKIENLRWVDHVENMQNRGK